MNNSLRQKVVRALRDRGFCLTVLLSIAHVILAFGHTRDSGRTDYPLPGLTVLVT